MFLGGAWIPEFKDTNQFIQVDLGEPNLVYGIATQGHASLQSWVTAYEVIYSIDGVQFSHASPSFVSGTFSPL